ncbi:MAG: DEAD/DEAH box helicase [Chlorobi bacterium]|nr:DEAD/DEAH box helicase [Chlorobiota bacterium]
MLFNEFGLNEQLLEAISHIGFKEATPIQIKTIPAIMQGRDLLGSAQTGTGKTAAFLLPVINNLLSTHERATSTLIIVPTRELAMQIDQHVQGFTYFTDIGSLPVYGGGDGLSWEQQKKALTSGVDIIVATPGKLISHLNMGYVKFDKLKYLILDEADRMLDMGFYDDIKKIITYLPEKRQTLMFSATMPPKIRELARQILHDPVEVSIALAKPAEGVLQAAYLVYDTQKNDMLTRLIADGNTMKSVLIFASTKKKVIEIVRALKKRNISVEGISSDLEQNEREEVLMRFKSKNTRVLVATDVLSRGIDIKEIDLIVNYDVPGDAEDYVHRVGRTARADASGVAVTFINDEDMYKFRRIEKLIGQEITKLILPVDLGHGPEWNPNATEVKRRSPGKFSKGRQSRKPSYRKKRK